MGSGNLAPTAADGKRASELTKSGPGRRNIERKYRVLFVSTTQRPDDALNELATMAAGAPGVPIEWIPAHDPFDLVAKGWGSAAVLWLSIASNLPSHVHTLVETCLHELNTRDDIRLFVYLDGIAAQALQDSNDEVLRKVHEIVQLTNTTDLQKLVSELKTYLSEVDSISSRAIARKWKLDLTSRASALVHFLQHLYALFILAPFIVRPYWGWENVLAWLRTLNQSTIAFAIGFVFFPSITVIAYSLFGRLHSIATSGGMGLAACIVIGSSVALRNDLNSPDDWILFGAVTGAFADYLRRRGIRANWQREILRGDLPRKDEIAANKLKRLLTRHSYMTPLGWKLFRDRHPVVFISYTTHWDASSRDAESLHELLKNGGATVYLDRMFLRYGSNWRRQLHYRFGEANTFVAFVDSESVQREWPAFELHSALEERNRTGIPDVILIVDPGVDGSDAVNWYPVFLACLKGTGSQSLGVRVITRKEGVLEGLSAEMKRPRFSSPGLLPRPLGALLQHLLAPFVSLSRGAQVGGGVVAGRSVTTCRRPFALLDPAPSKRLALLRANRVLVWRAGATDRRPTAGTHGGAHSREGRGVPG